MQKYLFLAEVRTSLYMDLIHILILFLCFCHAGLDNIYRISNTSCKVGDIWFPLRPYDVTCHGHSAKSWVVGQKIILFISVLRSGGLRCNVKGHPIHA
jgi:hypothetical protein